MKTGNRLGWISNLSSKYEKYRYLFLEEVDPSPPKKRGGEDDILWYKRIAPKYALRHARMIYKLLANLDATYQRTTIPGALDIYPKKFQKSLLELARVVNLNTQIAKQRLQDLLDVNK